MRSVVPQQPCLLPRCLASAVGPAQTPTAASAAAAARAVLHALLPLPLAHRASLEASQALIEAYKQHLSDEVASHHQREENWLHIQEDWERLEKELEQEIIT